MECKNMKVEFDIGATSLITENVINEDVTKKISTHIRSQALSAIRPLIQKRKFDKLQNGILAKPYNLDIRHPDSCIIHTELFYIDYKLDKNMRLPCHTLCIIKSDITAEIMETEIDDVKEHVVYEILGTMLKHKIITRKQLTVKGMEALKGIKQIFCNR